jgi:formylglycine-generating enzyme required for sulfatase activity
MSSNNDQLSMVPRGQSQPDRFEQVMREKSGMPSDVVADLWEASRKAQENPSTENMQEYFRALKRAEPYAFAVLHESLQEDLDARSSSPPSRDAYPLFRTLVYGVVVIAIAAIVGIGLFLLQQFRVQPIVTEETLPTLASIGANNTPLPASAIPTIVPATTAALPTFTTLPIEATFPAPSPTASFIPTVPPTPAANVNQDTLLQAALERARNFPDDASNSDWSPYIYAFENGVEMVLVPAGCFLMGSSQTDLEFASELAAADPSLFEYEAVRDSSTGSFIDFSVCFDAFWIDRYEVTNGQWNSLNPFPRRNVTTFTGGTMPVTVVAWSEARDYCASRGGRLPTEAQWEYAAVGPSNWTFVWEFRRFIEEYAVTANTAEDPTTGERRPSEVGSRATDVTWTGAFDFNGNVHEWTSTIFDQDAFPYPYDASDGRESDNANVPRRVARGPAFSSGLPDTRIAIRYSFSGGLDAGRSDLGFRCMRPI